MTKLAVLAALTNFILLTWLFKASPLKFLGEYHYYHMYYRKFQTNFFTFGALSDCQDITVPQDPPYPKVIVDQTPQQ